jgi:hypothetical protein
MSLKYSKTCLSPYWKHTNTDPQSTEKALTQSSNSICVQLEVKICGCAHSLVPFFKISTMSLAEASEARKARLIALRKRKAGEAVDGHVLIHSGHRLAVDPYMLSDETVIKNRNYDPESRTLKKRTRDDDAIMQDTVEKDVEGLAQNIIAEDEQRRAQELVSEKQVSMFSTLIKIYHRTYSTSRQSGRTGI